MKKTIGIVLALAMVLSSCNWLGSIMNPIIGTWETTILSISVNSIFNADGSFTDTNSLGAVGVTENGIWDSDETTITKTWQDNTVSILSYAFNSDNSEMTLTANSGGTSITYARQ